MAKIRGNQTEIEEILNDPLAAASNIKSGSLRIATQIEVDAGTDTLTAVTPNTLSNFSGLGSITLSGLTDVTITTPVLNEVLTYNGSTWVNQAPSGAAANNWLIANNGVDFTTSPTAAGSNSISIGDNARNVNGINSITLGTTAYAYRTGCVAIGNASRANRDGAIAIGDGANTNGTTSNNAANIAIGTGAQATDGGPNIALGKNAYAASTGTIAIGSSANVSAVASFATVIGNLSSSSFDSCTIIGAGCVSSTFNQTIIGKDITSADVPVDVSYSVKIGTGVAGQLNMLHLHTKGLLELVGDNAQFIFPNYITASIPATTTEGGAIWDATTKELKIYNGTAFTAIGGGGGLANIVEDTTPQLGGNLDVNGFDIITPSSSTATSPSHIQIRGGDKTYVGGGYAADSVHLYGGSATNNNQAGAVFLQAGNASGTSDGGGITIESGSATGTGACGTVNIRGVDTSGATVTSAGSMVLRGGNAFGSATSTAGGDISMYGGSAVGGTAGVITIRGGLPSGSGVSSTVPGAVNITAGGHLTTYGSGSDLNLKAGAGFFGAGFIGGDVNIDGGPGNSNADGGHVNITGGNTTYFSTQRTPGNVVIAGGTGTTLADGGNISIVGGAATGAAYGGNVTIKGGADVAGNGIVAIGNSTDGAKLVFNNGTKITMSGTLDATNNDIDNIKTITFNGEVANTTTTQTVDWTVGQKQKTTITAATTITFTAPIGLANLTLKIINGGLGIITWPVSIKWPGGTEPTWTSSGTDIVTFYYDGTDYFGSASLAFA